MLRTNPQAFNSQLCTQFEDIVAKATTVPTDTEQLMALKGAVKAFETDVLPRLTRDIERARARLEFLIDHSTLTL